MTIYFEKYRDPENKVFGALSLNLLSYEGQDVQSDKKMHVFKTDRHDLYCLSDAMLHKVIKRYKVNKLDTSILQQAAGNFHVGNWIKRTMFGSFSLN